MRGDTNLCAELSFSLFPAIDANKETNNKQTIDIIVKKRRRVTERVWGWGQQLMTKVDRRNSSFCPSPPAPSPSLLTLIIHHFLTLIPSPMHTHIRMYSHSCARKERENEKKKSGIRGEDR